MIMMMSDAVAAALFLFRIFVFPSRVRNVFGRELMFEENVLRNTKELQYGFLRVVGSTSEL